MAWRAGRETALLKLTEDWRACRERKELVAVVAMDLSKAFDTILTGAISYKRPKSLRDSRITIPARS